MLRALRESPAVLLVDEIDRADDEFEAFLLEVLSTYQVTIPELGTITAPTPPIVVLTSNRTRELHDALKRRCLYHWVEHPGLDREIEIVRTRAPEVSETLARQVATLVQRLRTAEGLLKPPGVAETLDWARALEALGASELDVESAAADARRRREVPRGRPAGQAGPGPDAGGMTPPAGWCVHEPDELLLGFARALRAAGVPVTQDRSQAYLEATALVGLDDQPATYWAGRATLCSGPDDLDRYDEVFTAWFHARSTRSTGPRKDQRSVSQADAGRPVDGEGGGEPDEDVLRAMASETEVLRHRDIADMAASEKARLAAMFETLHPRPPRRPAHRRTPWHRGDVDAQRTLRRMLERMGEPGEIAWRRRSDAAAPGGAARRRVRLDERVRRRAAAARAPVQPPGGRAAAPTGPRVEVFTVGTRLTRVTRAMRMRDAERAIVAAGETVADWSGGTRLGETLRIFMDRWGQRGLARGAVVVVFSDGWERGDTALLGEQMRRLHRTAHRVVWVNPHVGKRRLPPRPAGNRRGPALR